MLNELICIILTARVMYSLPLPALGVVSRLKTSIWPTPVSASALERAPDRSATMASTEPTPGYFGEPFASSPDTVHEAIFWSPASPDKVACRPVLNSLDLAYCASC